MKLSYFSYALFIVQTIATPVPANVQLKAVSYSSNGPSTKTFPTLIPTYTPVQRILEKEKDVRILFNNKEEIANADAPKHSTILLTYADSSISGEASEQEIYEYKLF